MEAPKPPVNGRKWKRISATNFADMEQILKAATVLLVPDGQTQREAFEKLMPCLYILRNKGCSFPQIASLLTTCGLDLQLDSVRSYYNEFLVIKADTLQQRMNETLLMLAEVRKETKGADVESLAQRATAVVNRQRISVESRIDSLFGSGSALALTSQPTPPNSIATPRAAAALDDKADKPVRPSAVPTPAASAGFGLVSAQAGTKRAADASSVFGHDETAPMVPQLNIAPVQSGTGVATPSTTPAKLKCQPLQKNLPPLKRRDRVPEEVYLPGLLEHPAVPGLMLSLEERLYSAALEIVDEAGEIRLETLQFEKRFRILWQKPIPTTPSSSSASFTRMNPKHFEKAKPAP